MPCHENDPEVCWLLVEVPEFETFCPIQKGILPPDTCPQSLAYFSAYQALLDDYYVAKAALILEMPAAELRRVSVLYGPKPFSLVERTGDSARVAANGVVAGGSLANGHFLHSAGAMCGMLGHAHRFLEYWRGRDAGHGAAAAIWRLADRIRRDSDALLAVSAREFSRAVPSNFGAERGRRRAAASGIARETTQQNVGTVAGEVKKERTRWTQEPLNPTDWLRPFMRNGRVWTGELPRIGKVHPVLRYVAKL
ncbi:efflux protein [Apiospora aurea]|uniref:Efflux protein n=1 Tax=Apiospora aurea TaxID=335848 RepID=A0ABR1Q582_9PEZI